MMSFVVMEVQVVVILHEVVVVCVVAVVGAYSDVAHPVESLFTGKLSSFLFCNRTSAFGTMVFY